MKLGYNATEKYLKAKNYITINTGKEFTPENIDENAVQNCRLDGEQKSEIKRYLSTSRS